MVAVAVVVLLPLLITFRLCLLLVHVLILSPSASNLPFAPIVEDLVLDCHPVEMVVFQKVLNSTKDFYVVQNEVTCCGTHIPLL